MKQITVTKRVEVAVTHLKVSAGVRYWEDATVNGVTDEEGDLIPFRKGDRWEPTIELSTGLILGWPAGTTANIHYTVCDDGVYTLLNERSEIVMQIDDYVINCLSPGRNGYGDYIIMQVDGNGQIANWKPDLSDFTEGD